MFAEQTGQQLHYQAVLAPKEGFAAALTDFFANPDAKGCNVTLPFKGEAAEWVDQLTGQAAVANAVNTIIRQSDGTFRGDNTDGYGLVLDLLSQGASLEDASILLIGAGGAAKGVLNPLLESSPARLHIVNRTEEKAMELAQQFESPLLTAGSFEELNKGNVEYDIIINSTSASLDGHVPPVRDELIARSKLVYDMVYGDEPTCFLKHAESLGVIKLLDGLGMLVGQAAQSFFLWRNERPDIQKTLQQLRAGK